MTVIHNQLEAIEAQRALEVFRKGVFNRDLVWVLGSGQPVVEKRFKEQLKAACAGLESQAQAPGLHVEGGLGSGKSHVLRYLEHVALEQKFVCSHVSVSKETPLYNPEKLFKAAIEAAVSACYRWPRLAKTPRPRRPGQAESR